ncbi:hypothetical protein Tsp_06706 [Trichinella spiralis]|uniref:hypothetical protein n=1 Tax=Trichinella spiralis TaxID=6334 RepID=UPI0001EFBFF7|nr:hypothetical protein Tsp_06706 [Trichinella spiralis]
MERRLRRRKFLYAEEQYQLLLREQRNNVAGRNLWMNFWWIFFIFIIFTANRRFVSRESDLIDFVLNAALYVDMLHCLLYHEDTSNVQDGIWALCQVDVQSSFPFFNDICTLLTRQTKSVKSMLDTPLFTMIYSREGLF